MKTVWKSGPGLFAAYSSKGDRTIAPDKVHVYMASVEVLELENTQLDNDTSFKLIAAKAEEDPRLARALLILAECVEQNRLTIQRSAEKLKG